MHKAAPSGNAVKSAGWRRFAPAWLILFLPVGPPLGAADPVVTNALPVVIPYESRQGQIMVSARVNGSEPMTFLLDTGYSMTMLRADRVEALGLNRAGEVTIVGIAGEEKGSTWSGATFDFAGATYTPSRVASQPSLNKGRGRRRDGILGSGFFRRFVVEIDPAAKKITLHDPKTFRYEGFGETNRLTFDRSTPILEASVTTPGGEIAKGKFEIDTGCSGALCLGKDFIARHKLAPAGDKGDGVRVGVGGEARTKEGTLPQFQIGSLKIDKPDVDFFLDGSPGGEGMAGHIGMGVLRQFKMIFDYSRRQVILEPLPKR